MCRCVLRTLNVNRYFSDVSLFSIDVEISVHVSLPSFSLYNCKWYTVTFTNNFG